MCVGAKRDDRRERAPSRQGTLEKLGSSVIAVDMVPDVR